jgi:RimJ/RimL family protein N-acetyltransferase
VRGFAEPIAPVTLANDFVHLEPLRADHVSALVELTVGQNLTRWFPQPLDERRHVEQFVAEALDLAAKQLALPFAIVTRDGRIAGSTRFGAVVAEHRRVEIGWTFVGRDFQRTPVNTAAKLLLMTHGFERLGCIRVELKTDARNAVSRAAIARLGATEEGTLRHHVICADGHLRDTVYFSVLAQEWPGVKAGLQAKLAPR